MTDSAPLGRRRPAGLQVAVMLVVLIALVAGGIIVAIRSVGPPDAPQSVLTGEAAERAWGQLDGCVAVLVAAQGSVDAFHARTGHYPTTLAEAMSPSPVATCPAAGRDTYSASWRVSGDGKGYSIQCSGRWHSALGVPADRPLFASDRGLVLPVGTRRHSVARSSAPLDPQAEQCVINLKSLGTAVEIYAAQNRERLPDHLSSLLPSVMTVMPTCPAAGRDTYSATYQKSQDALAYTIACGGRHHQAAGLPADHPWTSTQGGVRTGARSGTPKPLPPSP